MTYLGIFDSSVLFCYIDLFDLIALLYPYCDIFDLFGSIILSVLRCRRDYCLNTPVCLYLTYLDIFDSSGCYCHIGVFYYIWHSCSYCDVTALCCYSWIIEWYPCIVMTTILWDRMMLLWMIGVLLYSWTMILYDALDDDTPVMSR